MREQIIEFVSCTKRIVSFEREDSFQLRSDRPAIWMQKMCFFVLRKLRAFSIEESVKIERHLIDSKSFMEQLFKQCSGIERFFNIRPTKILIGAEDYAELMHESVALNCFSFNAEYGHGKEICGLKVEIIPWMRGILVMPDK